MGLSEVNLGGAGTGRVTPGTMVCRRSPGIRGSTIFLLTRGARCSKLVLRMTIILGKGGDSSTQGLLFSLCIETECHNRCRANREEIFFMKRRTGLLAVLLTSFALAVFLIGSGA